jgi:hypothetical protein
MGGMSFKEKALNEIKEGMRDIFYNSYRNKYDLAIKKNKIVFDRFYASHKCSIWNRYKASVNQSHTKFFQALSHFEYGDMFFHPAYNAFTGCYEIDEETGIYDKHPIHSSIVSSIKVFKNGKVEIEFADSEKARVFAKEYCGYVEQAT